MTKGKIILFVVLLCLVAAMIFSFWPLLKEINIAGKVTSVFPVGETEKIAISINNHEATPVSTIELKKEKTFLVLSGKVVITRIKDGTTKEVTGCSEDARLVLVEQNGKEIPLDCEMSFSLTSDGPVRFHLSSSKYKFKKTGWWKKEGYQASGVLYLQTMTAFQKKEFEEKIKETAEKTKKKVKEKLEEIVGHGFQDAYKMFKEPDKLGVKLPPMTNYPEIPKKEKEE